MNDSVEQSIAVLNKAYGQGFIMRGGDKPVETIEAIPTGSLTLDRALGIGGFPVGRIVEIFGPASCGKTTLALQVVANAQKIGGECAYIDMEHALDLDYAKKLGVDIDKILISQPSCGEEALEAADRLCRTGLKVVVIDSVAALMPRAELEGDIGDPSVGTLPRLMSQALRKLPGSANPNTLLIFINQIRMKIGVFYGNPEVTSGGEALKYYSSMRVQMRQKEQIKEKTDKGEGDIIGNKVIAKVVKNKLAPPFKEANFEIRFGKGVYRVAEILELAEKMGIVKKGGSWYSYHDTKIGQGTQNAVETLEQNKELSDRIEKEIQSGEVA